MADRVGESDGEPAAPSIRGLRLRERLAGVVALSAAESRIGVQTYSSFGELPEPLVAFLDEAAERCFFHGIPWFRTILKTAGRRGDEPRIYVAERGGRPVAVLVARERRSAGRLKTHMLLGPSLSTYALFYGPILDPERGIAGLHAIVAAIARTSPPFDVLRFDGLDHGSPDVAALMTAFRRAGMLVQRFFGYHNYYETVDGLTIEDYLARRSPKIRRVVGRNVRRMARSGRGRFVLVEDGPGLEAAFLDYSLVDLQSWRDPETYPDCIPEMLRVAAGAGVLRLGLFYVDDAPAAAQIWIVSGGRATIMRFYHAKKFAKLSVGMVLTFEMLRHVLAEDKIREVDFGPGGDEFKQDWLSQRRERGGLLVFNPRTVKGLVRAARHIGGHAAAASVRKLRRGLRRVIGRA